MSRYEEPDLGDEPLPPPTPEEQEADAWEYWHQRARHFEEALHAIAGFGDVNLAGEYEHSLRDIIRSMTDCAKNALRRAGFRRTNSPKGAPLKS